LSRSTLAVGVVLLFAALVGLGVHGFSISAWHGVIDGSTATEVLVGKPQLIRSDDWQVQLPLAFSQGVQRPSFPLVNPLVGLGQSALLPIELPVASPLVLFRPTQWGFFLGDDAGMAWMWWSRVLGLLVVWFGVFCVVTDGRRGLSAGGAALLAASPFFQFWSFNAAPHAAAMGACFLASVWLARAASVRAVILAAAALAAAGAWFALAIYPPYQIALAWLYVALMAGFLLSEGPSLDLRRHHVARLVALGGAALFVAGVLLIFFAEAREAIQVMGGTSYPGRRISLGGEKPLWQLVTANFATGLWASHWGILDNICEQAGFGMLAPLPVLLWLWRSARGEHGTDRFALTLALYEITLVGFGALGVPEGLARVTGLSFVPARRAVIGVGLADTVLLLRYLAVAPPAGRLLSLALATSWALLLALASRWLGSALPEAGSSLPLALAAGNGALLWLVLVSRRRAAVAWTLALALLATTAWFNPVVVGGARFVKENPLSQKIVEIDRATPGGSTWVVFGRDDLAALFRAVGVRSVNGPLTLPQLELWQRIDPRQHFRAVYNRYAHVAFVASSRPEPEFQLYSQDYVIVRIDPAGPGLHDLGVTHVLFRGTEPERHLFERIAPLEELASIGESHLYRVPPPTP